MNAYPPSSAGRPSVILLLSLVGLLAATPPARAQSFFFGGVIGLPILGSTFPISPTELGRVVLDGNPSVVQVNKSYPGTLLPTTWHYYYNEFLFSNTSAASQDVTITITSISLNPLMGVAYLIDFDPNNVATNYLGDSGNSSIQGGSPVTYGVTIPAFTSFSLIVNEGNSPDGGGGYTGNAEYTMSVLGTGGIAIGSLAAVPESGPGMLYLLVGFISLAFAHRHSRATALGK